MGFLGAVKTCFRKFIDFKGRAPRSEFWWFVLFYYIAIIFIGVIEVGAMGVSHATDILSFWLRPSALMGWLLYVPYMAVSFRRIHDVNRSGWWVGAPILVTLSFLIFSLMGGNPLIFVSGWVSILFIIVSLVYSVVMFIWFITLGTVGDNKYGPDPLEGHHKEDIAPAK